MGVSEAEGVDGVIFKDEGWRVCAAICEGVSARSDRTVSCHTVRARTAAK